MIETTNSRHYLDGNMYVISKAIVRLIVEKLFNDPRYCKQLDMRFDDVEIGRCYLKKDEKNNHIIYRNKKKFLFVPIEPRKLLFPIVLKIFEINYFDKKNGFSNNDELTEFPVTFESLPNDMMYGLEYLFNYIAFMNDKFILNSKIDFGNLNYTEEVKRKYEIVKKFYNTYFSNGHIH
uniref:Hexosyltransferase n=1 Tax=Parastrongyloides trichosuri TaxID=131310 RepID=A0A0N4ZR29_PARTI